MIQAAQQTTKPSQELIDVWDKMITGILCRYFSGLDKEDCRQEAMITLITKLHLMKTDRNCFNYCTTLILNTFRRIGQRQATYARVIGRVCQRGNLPVK